MLVEGSRFFVGMSRSFQELATNVLVRSLTGVSWSPNVNEIGCVGVFTVVFWGGICEMVGKSLAGAVVSLPASSTADKSTPTHAAKDGKTRLILSLFPGRCLADSEERSHVIKTMNPESDALRQMIRLSRRAQNENAVIENEVRRPG